MTSSKSKTEPQKAKIPHSVISWFFLLYFLILYSERLQSLIRAAAANELFVSSFESAASIITLLSLLAGIIMLVFFNGSFRKSLYRSKEPDYSMLSVTSGVILVSGMIHTLYTIPVIQFISYGMLIIAMILREIQLAKDSKNPFGLWYSLVYLTVFSMAIPVVYQFCTVTNPTFLHVIEYIVMFALVSSFTLMLRLLFIGRGENLLLWIPFIIMAAGDTAVLWMGWSETVNTFVLIFASLSVVLFIAGKFLLKKNIRKPQNK